MYITGVIYPIVVYWTWGGGFLSHDYQFVDFAGSSVVHACGAFAGLAQALGRERAGLSASDQCQAGCSTTVHLSHCLNVFLPQVCFRPR